MRPPASEIEPMTLLFSIAIRGALIISTMAFVLCMASALMLGTGEPSAASVWPAFCPVFCCAAICSAVGGGGVKYS